ENNAILIGKNGQTLQSINAVVRAAANAEFKRRFRVLVDVNGYKESRYEKVKALAKRIAKTVQRTKDDASLDPMPNDERKAIHQVLADMPHIVTQSEGEGAARHLKIMYKADKD
ncbi:MAG: protein jag, partial [Erysipelotrichaceae bacterium]|nr:protein jag [Erysipelotrichaceae bacterium]